MSANGNEVAVESNGKVEEPVAGDVKKVSPAKRKPEEELEDVVAEKKAKIEVTNGDATGEASEDVEGLDEEDLDDEDEDVDEEDEEEEDEDEEGGEEDEEEGGDEEEEG